MPPASIVEPKSPTDSALVKAPTPLWPRINIVRQILTGRIRDNRTTQQAAALTYNTLFSLLPTIVLGLIVMSMVFTNQDVRHAEMALFQRFGLSQIENRGATGGQSHLLIKTLNGIIAKIRTVLQNPGTGAVGFVVLLWTAISLMRVIESTFGHIYCATSPRPWARRLTLYWCVLTLGPLGLAMSFYFSARFLLIAGSVSAVQIFLMPLTLLASYLSVWVIIFLFYKIIPNTYVTWKAAMTGSLIATILWGLAKYAFGLYVLYVAGYGKWYGNLGLIPLFMFWIYLTWIFLLLGLEVAYIQQQFPLLLRRLLNQRQQTSPLVDPKWILPLAALLVQRFREGKTVDADLVAKNLHLSPNVAGEFLTALHQAGLAHVMDGNEPQYALARSPENISLWDLFQATGHRCQTLLDATHSTEAANPLVSLPVIRQMQAMEEQWTRERTLAELVPAAAPIKNN